MPNLSAIAAGVRRRLSAAAAAIVFRLGLLPLIQRAVDRRHTGHSRSAGPSLGGGRPRPYQILTYHRVNDDEHPYFPGVSTRLFEAQITLLARYFTVLPLDELLQRTTVGDVPPNAVSITFDDGYRDNFVHAFKVLVRYGLPATVFLATGVVDRPCNLWHDNVFNGFESTTAQQLEWNATTYDLRSPRTKTSALHAVLDDLRSRGSADRDAAIVRLLAGLQVSVEHLPIADKLRWDEIRQMAQNGISFGGHTVSHPILTSIPLAEAEAEIRQCKSTIEHQLDRPVELFAYPNGRSGDLNDSIKDILEGAGFAGAVTTIWGVNSAQTDRFELCRVQMWDSDPRVSALRLAMYRGA